jgi:FkbM family methyltransferase
MIEVQGNKMYVVPSRSGTERTLFIFKSYEKGITRLFHSLVKSGMTVVDIGAHIGYYTLLSAQIVGPKGKVFAFEPEPKNYDLLKKNVAENGYNNVTLVEKAVSNGSSIARLSVDLKDSGMNYLANTINNSITVSTVSLDEFFDEAIVIDFIKMDIEGFEEKALEGMQRILKKGNVKAIIAEFYPKLIKRNGFSPKILWDRLSALGLEIYQISDGEDNEINFM